MTSPEGTIQAIHEPPVMSDQEKRAVHAEASHEPTLYAETVFFIGNFPVTNSLLNSWIVVLCILLFSVFVRKSLKTIPKGIQNFMEFILEGAMNISDSVTGAREKTLKFLPVVFPIFVFVLLNNWLGIVPGVGSIGFFEIHGGERVFVPLFRGATADLNTTLALAITAVILTHIFGVMLTSSWSHLNRFVGIRHLTEIPRKVFREKDYTAIFLNPIQFLVGIIEIVGEMAKVASLSFRLFGNIFAGEVLLGAMAALFAFVLPIPFLFLEIIVGMMQALIFATLMLVFLTVMSESHGSREHHA